MYIKKLPKFNADGEIEVYMWGVYDSEGGLLERFLTQEEAQKYLEENEPKPEPKAKPRKP